MPHLEIGDARIHYSEAGAGPETIVFSHGLLFSGAMFAAQMAHFGDRYRCIAFDHRGQGRSRVTRSGYDMDSLTADAAGLIEALDAAPCHFVGLSMGGFVGLRLALRRPDLLRSLTLIDSTAEAEPVANRVRYRALALVARCLGTRAVVGRVMPIMFGPAFLQDPDRAAERARWRAAIQANHRAGIARAVGGVVGRAGLAGRIGRIGRPVLVMVGERDVATPPDQARRMQAAIPGARLAVIPGAGHSATIEAPDAVNAALAAFLDAAGS